LKNIINIIFDWIVKLKRRINLVKELKEIQKNKNQNWHKKQNQCFDWIVKLKRIISFTKEQKTKIKNQNNENQIGKHNFINLNWIRMKLRTNKISTKEPWL